MEDKEIVAKILKGSVDDYSLLVKRYQSQLQNTLSFYCQNTQEIEYFMHEAFVKAFSKLHTYKTEYSFFPWLKTLAINLLRDEIRGRKNLSEDAKAFLIDHLTQEKQPDNRLEILRHCLGSLEEGQRDLMKLRYWAKIGIDELADKMGRKSSALKMQILRIRELLKKCIDEKSGAVNE